MNIRKTIVERRMRRIAAEGHTLGVSVPERRPFPLVFGGRGPFLAAEIKRRSPSKGEIDGGLDPAARSGLYLEGGASVISVLTEEDHFGGSLRDLLAVKAAFPEACVLRKDFLVDEDDVDVSFRAGADIVLLIASMLDGERLARLHEKARGLGLQTLVEVRSEADVAKARGFRPPLVGINSRDLGTFAVDLLHPCRIKRLIDWDARVVFESGITGEEGAFFAGSSGFAGVLAGEAVVRDFKKVPEILRGLRRGFAAKSAFWNVVAGGGKAGRPLVKICGITNEADARLAEDLGADLLGFVFAGSPRKVEPAFAASLPRGRALRIGVVVLETGESALPPGVRMLLEEGKLDALQFHGNETPELCASFGAPYYKALRPAGPGAFKKEASVFGCPRVLLDARSDSAYGGTGLRVPDDVVRAASGAGPLWLAGGLGPDSIRETVEIWRPELVDASSRLEASPGRKDRTLMERFFREMDHASER